MISRLIRKYKNTVNRLVYHRAVLKLLYLSLILFVSCNSVNTLQNPYVKTNAVLNTSIYTSNFYIGISGRMRFHEFEIEEALLHIANQIVMREKCVIDKGIIAMHANQNSNSISDSNLEYDDSNIDDIIKHITIEEKYIFPELIVIIGKDTRNPGILNPGVPKNKNARPLWIRNPESIRNLPDFENYLIGVGVSERYSLFYRGIIVADIRAAHAIAGEIGIYTENYFTASAENNSARINSGVIALTQAELKGFYILDRWIEPDGSKCYSLGIADKY